MSTIVVFVEQEHGKAVRASLECLGAARATGATVVAVVGRDGADRAASTLGRFGASKVVCLAGAAPYSPDATARDVAAVDVRMFRAPLLTCRPAATACDPARPEIPTARSVLPRR